MKTIKQIIFTAFFLYSGFLYSQSDYSMGKACYRHEGDTSYYVYADSPPEFPGGDSTKRKLIDQHLKFPNNDTTLKGIMLINFIIETDGSLSGFYVGSTSFQAELVNEAFNDAVNALKSLPKFSPARCNGRLVRVMGGCPVIFDKSKK